MFPLLRNRTQAAKRIFLPVVQFLKVKKKQEKNANKNWNKKTYKIGAAKINKYPLSNTSNCFFKKKLCVRESWTDKIFHTSKTININEIRCVLYLSIFKKNKFTNCFF